MNSADRAADIGAALKCDLASEVLRSFGRLRFRATGWSMFPSLWPGDTLVVEHVMPHKIQVGDVALVGRDGRLCAHRIVSKPAGSVDSRWITQGDAMSAPDRPVSEGELLGRVSYLIRGGKLVAAPAELNVAGRLIAKIVRRSVPVARALVYLHRLIQAAKESVPCLG